MKTWSILKNVLLKKPNPINIPFAWFEWQDVSFHCFIVFLNLPRHTNRFVSLGTSSHIFKKKDLGIVYSTHFVYDFSRKIFIKLSFCSNSFHTWSKCKDQDLDISRMNWAFQVKHFSFLKYWFEDTHCLMYKSSNLLVYVFPVSGQFFQITLAEQAL